jgi:hypothetical protein
MVWRKFKLTFEERVALMKPLSATEIEVLQHLADGFGTAEIAASRSTSAQVIKNYTYIAVNGFFKTRLMHSQRMRKLCSRWSRLVEEFRPR